MTSVVARLTTANVLGAASGFITGPLLARALGASGRGDLAAIVVPFTIGAAVLGLGISTYAYRELPRGRRIGDVIGSLAVPSLLMGLVGVAVAFPVADALAGGRPTVRTFLIFGFMSMPLALIASLLLTSLGALQRWRRVFVTNLTPFAVAFAGIGILYLTGHLTVASAAAATLSGSLLAIVPGLPLLWRSRPVFRVSIARAGVSFGLKSWFGGLAQITNARLDQFMMITLVAPRELGLYAVATTLAGASTLASGALAPPLMARIAAGESRLMAQAVRIVLASTVGLNLVLALAAPAILTVLFGPQFRDAYPMALVLLVAQVPLTAAGVLSSALQADGAPMIPSVAEGIAVVITIGGLVVLLRPLGGVGAAVVSLAAYGTSFLFQVVMARRRIGVPIREFLVPSRADVSWARSLFGSSTLRPRAAA